MRARKSTVGRAQSSSSAGRAIGRPPFSIRLITDKYTRVCLQTHSQTRKRLRGPLIKALGARDNRAAPRICAASLAPRRPRRKAKASRVAFLLAAPPDTHSLGRPMWKISNSRAGRVAPIYHGPCLHAAAARQTDGRTGGRISKQVGPRDMRRRRRLESANVA